MLCAEAYVIFSTFCNHKNKHYLWSENKSQNTKIVFLDQELAGMGVTINQVSIQATNTHASHM